MTFFKPCPAAAVLARTPENLVISGYRNWVAGLVQTDMRFWNTARGAHVSALGADVGPVALEALASLIAEIGLCARCPLRFYQPGSGHLCRDECLLLGLVAGAQHGDDQALLTSARLLGGDRALITIVDRAGAYGAILLGQELRLTPIPAGVLADIDVSATGRASSATHSIH